MEDNSFLMWTIDDRALLNDHSIVKELEFYFGDVNLPSSKFFQEKIEENDGWIPITELLTLKYLAAITQDVDEVAEAVKNVGSELVKISKDGKKVRRSPEKLIARHALMMSNAYCSVNIYVGDFVTGAHRSEVLKWANQFAEVKNVEDCHLTSNNEKFKGCFFVHFESDEEGQALLDSKDFWHFSPIAILDPDYIAGNRIIEREMRIQARIVKEKARQEKLRAAQKKREELEAKERESIEDESDEDDEKSRKLEELVQQFEAKKTVQLCEFNNRWTKMKKDQGAKPERACLEESRKTGTTFSETSTNRVYTEESPRYVVPAFLSQVSSNRRPEFVEDQNFAKKPIH